MYFKSKKSLVLLFTKPNMRCWNNLAKFYISSTGRGLHIRDLLKAQTFLNNEKQPELKHFIFSLHCIIKFSSGHSVQMALLRQGLSKVVDKEKKDLPCCAVHGSKTQCSYSQTLLKK